MLDRGNANQSQSKGVQLARLSTFLQINLIAPPHFVVTVQTMERAAGLAAVNACIEHIRNDIEQRGGSFKVTQEVLKE